MKMEIHGNPRVTGKYNLDYIMEWHRVQNQILKCKSYLGATERWVIERLKEKKVKKILNMLLKME